ncbi:MAG: UDP-4-amino-4,6-dideoxy-N-acetyl-beta-L-altrosamine transaminase, partial [Candidatus Omnitrophica bacterium]|nr:UDP-4-amino-4,6-dideoxy-N-acetyl-beta-L-altrosamine transaminase [Candidatus Omnitrophota bacterium]
MRLISYGRQTIDKDDVREVARVLKSDWITQGPKIEEFESSLARYCGARYAVCVSSGTAALHLACMAAGIRKGDEAITSPITFLATANSILYTGAKPVFSDINFETGNIDPCAIEKKISRKTKAILPVHFAGLPCDLLRIYEIARKNGVMVIEDACHALGAEYKFRGRWVKVGSCHHSDMTVFSFHPVKSITTGEGGAVVTNNNKLHLLLKALRSHGMYRDDMTAKNGPWYYEMRGLGFNYRITDFQCAMGLSQLKKIGYFLNRRRTIAEIYNKRLSDIDEILLPMEGKGVRSSWHLYAIRINESRNASAIRKDFFNYLLKNRIKPQVHYIPVYWHPYYKKLGYKKGLCLKAEEF